MSHSRVIRKIQPRLNQTSHFIYCCALTCLGLFFLLSASFVEAQDRYPVPWDKVEKETLEHFQALVRIDTSNPPGNETKAAEYLKKVFGKEGISAELLALDPNRANLVARIRGSGWFKKPILVMGHTDVVGVQKEKWSVDPFAAVRKDGYIWGRGTLDDKDNVTAGLMLMLLLKRQGVKLERDVIFLAEAGEEGFGKEGLRYVVASHLERINAEFALAEGGGGIIKDGKVQNISVATSEKVPRGMQLIAKGTAGHGSMPRPDNAIVHLANALARLGAWLPPMKLDETSRTYFERLAEISPPEEAARYRSLLTPKERNEAELYLSKNELAHNSMIRTSISPTVIKGGFRNNVIPSEAEAYLDIRALPDEKMDQFVKRMNEIIGDPNVEIKPIPWRDAAPTSKLGTEMFNALERTQKRLYPGSVTLPVLVTGATDMSQLRVKGVQAYGIGPLMLEKDIKEGVGAHSENERILEKSLHDFVRFVWYTVLEVAAAK